MLSNRPSVAVKMMSPSCTSKDELSAASGLEQKTAKMKNKSRNPILEHFELLPTLSTMKLGSQKGTLANLKKVLVFNAAAEQYVPCPECPSKT